MTTLGTVYFNRCKEKGLVNKVCRITVANGRRYLERTLYFNTDDGKYYVIVNRNAHPVKPLLNSRGEYEGRI